MWADMEKVLSGENDKKKRGRNKGRVGVSDVTEGAKKLKRNQRGGVRREALWG